MTEATRYTITALRDGRALWTVAPFDDLEAAQTAARRMTLGFTRGNTPLTWSVELRDQNGVLLPTGPDPFEEFWRAYPSRGEHVNPKKPAAAKFAAAVKRGANPKTIVAGAERYALSIRANGTEPQFVAQAVTWLNQERWEQYQNPPAPVLE